MTIIPGLSDSEAAQQRLRMKSIFLSLSVGALLLGLKFLTYQITHSSAVLSDALESIINVAASGFAALSIWFAAKPPDVSHPYGHGKIENFSAGFEGALIVLAAIGIFYTGMIHLLAPHPLPGLEKGVGILAAATVVNLMLSLYLLHVGRRTNSLALVADGRHIMTDVYTSVGVILGLGLVYLTGWLQLDGAIACAVGLNILYTGGSLVGDAYSRLMDASDPELLEHLARLLEKHRRPGWIDIHQLRAWRAGSLVHVDLHLVLPRDLILSEAHHEARLLEEMLVEQFKGRASVLVHMDPCDMPETCKEAECRCRQSCRIEESEWNREHLTRPEAGSSPPPAEETEKTGAKKEET